MRQINPKIFYLIQNVTIVLGVCLVYFPLSHAGFIWDDNDHLLNDRFLVIKDGLFRIWFAPEPSIWNYWPMTRTTFWIEMRLWGTSPFGYHMVNVVLHALSALIIFNCLRSLQIKGAWFVAAIFALHPLMVESVAWVSERKNVLSMFFYLLSISTYLYFDQEEEKKWKWFCASLIFFVAGVLSKTSVVGLPIILILCREWLNRTWSRRDFFCLAPFFLVSLLAGAINIYSEKYFVGTSAIVSQRSLLERINIAGQIPFFYIGKFFAPYPLISIYPPFKFGVEYIRGFVLLGLLTCAVLLLAFNYKIRACKSLLLCLLAFLTSIGPVLGLFKFAGMRHAMVADHWVYVGVLPLSVIAGVGLQTMLDNREQLRIFIVVIILFFLGALTCMETKKYQNQEVFWLTVLQKNPENYSANMGLGAVYYFSGRLKEALEYTNKAISLGSKDDLLVAYTNRGAMNLDFGRKEEAISDYKKAISLNPEYMRPYYGLGIVFYNSSDFVQALDYFTKAIELERNFVPARINHALTLQKLGSDNQAMDDLIAALDIDPYNVQALKEAVKLSVRLGKYANGSDYYHRLVAVSPGDSELSELAELIVKK